MASIELAKSFFDALSLMDPPSLNKTTTDEAQEAELEIKNAKAAAERERSLPPAKAPYLPRAGLIFAMVRERVEFDEKMARKNAHAFHKTYVGNEKSFCATALSQLRKVTLSEMLVRKVHKGSYLLCRIIAPSHRIVCVQTAIGDPQGNARMLALYNFPGAEYANGRTLDTLFPIGTILAIREPYFKMALVGSPSAFIRVDSPSDVVFVDPGDAILNGVVWREQLPVAKVPQTVSEWKTRGDNHFRDKEYTPAIVAYTRGLKIEPRSIPLLLNRCISHLRLGDHAAALWDAEQVTHSADVSQPDKIKALFRAGQAAYGASDYDAAETCYQRCLELDSSLAEAHAGLVRCAKRREEQAGQYDWGALFKASLIPASRVDVAEFVGPIRVTRIPGRGGGRGVVATRDVKVGELLVVSKPFSCVFPEELPKFQDIFSLNFMTNALNTKTQASNITGVISRLIANPHLASLVFGLYAGPSYPLPETQYPPTAPHAESSCYDPLQPQLDIDITRIEAVCSFNVFAPHQPGLAKFKTRPPDRDKESASALYLLPSLFNHSCAPSVVWQCFGDAMAIRAKRDVSIGDELTLSYAGYPSYEERGRLLSKHFKECDCSLCRLDRADGAVRCKRREVYIQATNERTLSLAEARKLLEQLKATYLPSRADSLRPELINAYHRVSHALQLAAMKAPDPTRLLVSAIKEEMNALTAAGLQIIDREITAPLPPNETDMSSQLPINTDRLPHTECTMLCLMIAVSLRTIDNVPRAKKWMRAVLWLEDRLMGGGVSLFRIRYAEVIETLQLASLLKAVAK